VPKYDKPPKPLRVVPATGVSDARVKVYAENIFADMVKDDAVQVGFTVGPLRPLEECPPSPPGPCPLSFGTDDTGSYVEGRVPPFPTPTPPALSKRVEVHMQYYGLGDTLTDAFEYQ